MIEAKDQRSEKQIAEDHLMSAEMSLVEASNNISDKYAFEKAQKLIVEVRELRNIVRKQEDK